jgi:hypothetical protein
VIPRQAVRLQALDRLADARLLGIGGAQAGTTNRKWVRAAAIRGSSPAHK